MPPTLTGRLSNVASLDGSAVGVRWIGSHALLANCGDKTTSSAILNDTDGAERIFTFADGGWSGDFASAPAAVRNELSILNTGPFFIFTDGGDSDAPTLRERGVQPLLRYRRGVPRPSGMIHRPRAARSIAES